MFAIWRSEKGESLPGAEEERDGKDSIRKRRKVDGNGDQRAEVDRPASWRTDSLSPAVGGKPFSFFRIEVEVSEGRKDKTAMASGSF